MVVDAGLAVVGAGLSGRLFGELKLARVAGARAGSRGVVVAGGEVAGATAATKRVSQPGHFTRLPITAAGADSLRSHFGQAIFSAPAAEGAADDFGDAAGAVAVPEAGIVSGALQAGQATRLPANSSGALNRFWQLGQSTMVGTGTVSGQSGGGKPRDRVAGEKKFGNVGISAESTPLVRLPHRATGL